MNNTDGSKKPVPPYIAYRTLSNFLEGFKRELPQRIDKTLMKSMAGGLQSQVIVALEYLGLTEAGVTTEIMHRLVKSEGEKRKEIWKQILTEKYSFISEGGCDLTRATEGQLQECFARAGASGDTARKSYAFFVRAAKDAGLELSSYILKPGKQQRAAGGKPRRKPLPPVQNGQEDTLGGKSKPPVVDRPSDPKPEFSSEDRFLLDKLISKLPEFDPKWEPEIKAEWLKAFRELRGDLKATGEK